MNSIYKKLEKIDDTKSLNEKWNVKNQTELKKLIKESIDGADDAIEAAREYILDQHSWNDYDYDETDTEFSMTVWCGGGEYYDDEESETKYVMSIQKLVDLMNNRKAFEQYIDECSDHTDYESLGDDFYRRAEDELNKHFNCTGAFLEPSTQLGRGRTFLFADDMNFEGSFDFQTGEEYIRDKDFEGFLELCKNSFSPVTNESLNEDAETSNAVKTGISNIVKTATDELGPIASKLEGSLVEYTDKYKEKLEDKDVVAAKESLETLIKYIQIEFIDKLNSFNNQLLTDEMKKKRDERRAKFRSLGIDI